MNASWGWNLFWAGLGMLAFLAVTGLVVLVTWLLLKRADRRRPFTGSNPNFSLTALYEREIEIARKSAETIFGPTATVGLTEGLSETGEPELLVAITYTVDADQLRKWLAFQHAVQQQAGRGRLQHLVLTPNPVDASPPG